MDLSKAKEIITPQGSLKKILKDGVVIWCKKAANKYKILKNNELVAEVTMTEFVDAIHSGAAQEDWGIGAQIVIPYTDSYDKKTYDCPFNFGTFKWYPGKLGLQTHYALPSKSLTYSSRSWMSGDFLSGLPKDFVDVVQTISFKSGNPRFFLLTATQSYANPVYNYKNSSSQQLRYYYRRLYGNKEEYSAWEYWIQRIGKRQSYGSVSGAAVIPTPDSNRKLYLISDKNTAVKTVTSTSIYISRMVNLVEKANEYYQSGFGINGEMTNVTPINTIYFQPACVIG